MNPVDDGDRGVFQCLMALSLNHALYLTGLTSTFVGEAQTTTNNPTDPHSTATCTRLRHRP